MLVELALCILTAHKPLTHLLNNVLLQLKLSNLIALAHRLPVTPLCLTM